VDKLDLRIAWEGAEEILRDLAESADALAAAARETADYCKGARKERVPLHRQYMAGRTYERMAEVSHIMRCVGVAHSLAETRVYETQKIYEQFTD